MKTSSAWKMACIVLMFCAAAVIDLPAQTFITLYSFRSSEGMSPYAGLVQGTDGNFYGTTYAGGDYIYPCDGIGCGMVFKVTPSGTLTVLYDFTGPSYQDGMGPMAGLVQGTDGDFYGTTYFGGGGYGDGNGTVYKITSSGTLTILHSFSGGDGANPKAGLVQATDGSFWGTANAGGANGDGTVYKITSSGTLTTLHSFNGTDGANPQQALVQGSDGSFYGTTPAGGSDGLGTIFKITPGGALTTLHSFSGADGANPYAGLVQATDGSFWGTANAGGANGDGTVYKITSSGTLTTLYSFCPQPNCSDGTNPQARLVQATDGNFYGTASGGGGSPTCHNGCGTIFKITPSGTLTTLHSFTGFDGVGDSAGLVQATDRNFYGTGAEGGAYGPGTVFRLSVGPAQFVPAQCRLVDTRPQYGGNGPIQGGTSQDFPIPQEGGCNISATAAAYALNVTVVPQGPLGYLTIWPTGEEQPVVATLNSLDGRIKADAAIVQAGLAGAISIYATNTTNVVLDITGDFEPVSDSTLAFYPLAPCRVADTRYSSYPPGLGPPFLTGGQARDFPILNATSCNIPSSAQAFSLNFSVVPHGPLGYLTVWGGGPRPTISTLNDLPGQIIANAAIVFADPGGYISVYASSDTDLVIDINGYFAPAGAGGLSLYSVTPCRVIDTRKIGSGQPFSGTLTPPVDVADSTCGPPAAAEAYVFNATVVPTGALGYLTLWPDGATKPLVSTLNALDGSITNNMAIVPTTNGKVDAFASGLTQLILDISSYFAP